MQNALFLCEFFPLPGELRAVLPCITPKNVLRRSAALPRVQIRVIVPLWTGAADTRVRRFTAPLRD